MKNNGTRRCLNQDTKSLKKMPTPRHKVTYTYIIVLLFVVCLFVMNALGKATAQHIDINSLNENVCCGLGRNKDVGMGL